MKRFTHRHLLAALGLVLVSGCGATSRVTSPFHVGLATTPSADHPGAASPDPRPNVVTFRQSASPTASARRVAFRTPRPDTTVEPGDPQRDSFKKTWHIDIALRSGSTKLASTKQKLDRRLDLPMKLDVLGVFKSPTTPMDRKSEFALNTMAFGFGRTESEYFGWNVYGGFGIGADKTHQTFLTSKLDVDFKYGVYYTGFTAEYYPWTMPRAYDDMTWTERFKYAKPYFVGGVEFGYVSAEADGDYSVAFKTIYKDGETIRDWTFAIPVGVGWALPINEKWSLQSVFDYRFHFYRPEEYNGWNLTTALRRRM
jgi:hypothetical protein